MSKRSTVIGQFLLRASLVGGCLYFSLNPVVQAEVEDVPDSHNSGTLTKTEADTRPKADHYFKGTIGKFAVHLRLPQLDASVIGGIFYDRYPDEIPLTGWITVGRTTFKLYERGPRGGALSIL